jgi:hypothetical protein
MKEEKLTPEQQEMIEKINAKISELKKEDFAIDMERSKGVTLERNEFLGSRQREIEAEIGKLKSKQIE